MVSKPFILNRDVYAGSDLSDGLLVAYTAVETEDGEITISTSSWEILSADADGLVTAIDGMIGGGGLVWTLEPNASSSDLEEILDACDDISLTCVLRFQDDETPFLIQTHMNTGPEFLDHINTIYRLALSHRGSPIERLILSARLRYRNEPTQNDVNIDMKVGTGPQWTV